MRDLHNIIEQFRAKGEKVALCIIVETSGSTPLKTGSKMLVTSKGESFGTIGGGNLENKVIEKALEVIQSNVSKTYSYNLLQQLGMCCGGQVSVYIECHNPVNKLYIFGSGHVGRALAEVAVPLDFEVYIIDERDVEIKKIQSQAISKIPLSHDTILPIIPFDEHTFICIMTYDHQLDRDILSFCIKRKHAYLGMIGSRRKVEVTRKMFLEAGICTEEEFNNIDSPMGIEIKANTPEEIAVSILAKLIFVKNNKQTQQVKNKPINV